jgi:hypothetical protein
VEYGAEHLSFYNQGSPTPPTLSKATVIVKMLAGRSVKTSAK